MSNATQQANLNAAAAIPTREEVPAAQRWDLNPLYQAEDQWEADFAQLAGLASQVAAWQGQLNSAESIARLFEAVDGLERLLEKIYTYAHLRADEDTADQTAQARLARIRARFTEIAGDLAWIEPELLAHTTAQLEEWTASAVLQPHRYSMVRLLRRKPHTLSTAEETLLSRAGEIFNGCAQVFNLFTNADLKFPAIRDAAGQTAELSEGRYHRYLIDPDRRVRQEAFNALYNTYGTFRNTLAATLSTTIKTHTYHARVRHHASALAAALQPDQVPLAVYEQLIRATHAALPCFHRYVALRQKRLGLATLDMCDLYVPLLKQVETRVSLEQALTWVGDACRPLGEEYAGVVCRGLRERWVDFLENRGKRSGAYSSGCYDSPPYILMNFQGTLDDVFTLAHEMGHSMHSWLANHAQPFRFAHYPIFVAEIASTVNELLLVEHLLEQTRDPALRAYLLNHLCDSFKGTVYRQVQFAEFERDLHAWDAAGQPLTAEFLSEKYYELNRQFYGPQVQADQRIALEWCRIPHFYYDFYVYKYATSFCAALVFAENVRATGGHCQAYLDLLRAGGSADPVALVQKAGVDLTDPAVFAQAFARFDATLTQFAKALDALPPGS